MKFNKKVKQLGSIALAGIIILSGVFISEGQLKEPPKPQIIVENPPQINPENPKVGEEAEITYTLHPQPFQHNISKPKEIVLVLDRSGSMDENIKVKCDHNQTKSHYYYTQNGTTKICTHSTDTGTIKTNYCITHGTNKKDHKDGKNKCILQRVSYYCTENKTEVSRCNPITKMQALKDATESFIEKMSEFEDLKIGIVTYSSSATIDSDLVDIKSEKETLINKVKSIEAIGGTNAGDGIRKAAYILKNSGNPSANKSIVFMSDGEPTFYTYEGSDSNNYYTNLDGKTPKTNEDNNESNNDAKGKEYALKIADIIKKDLNNSNIFTVGYGLDANGNKIMKEIHSSMGGVDENLHPTSESIDEIFDQIADDIIAQYKIENQKLDLKLDPSITMASDIKYGEIVYTREEDGWYRAEPVKITFKIKCNKDGHINIVNPGSKFEYDDILGNKVTVDIPEFAINIGLDSKVTIEVGDSSGIIKDKYDSSDNVGIRYDKMIENEFQQEYKLFGDSYADIRFKGSKINYLQYQIIKSEEKPGTLPTDGWKEIVDGSGGIPGDIDPNDPGKLTQKSYDVSHMPHIDGPEKWQDKNLVFKNPFSESREKPADISKDGNSYVTKVEYEYYNPIDHQYKKGYRWESNCIFTNNVNIGGDYKEANKTWGYLKVPKSGTYQFKTWSDDGIFAKLTKDGKQFIIADNFTPHGSTDSPIVTIELDANKYYPIYMEYFNWGGWGDYRLQYTEPGGTNFKDIPANCFYASKNKTPGESGDNSFTGSGNIKIPQEVGKYYIAYRAGTKEQTQNDFKLYKEGVYGPFIVDERFTLNRDIKENTSSDNSFDYILEYKLQPNPIRVTDIYKTKEQLINGTLKNELKIEGTKIIDNIPKQIKVTKNPLTDGSTNAFTPAVEELKDSDNLYRGSKLDGFVQGDIKYNLNRNSNKIEDSEYTSNPIIVRLGVSANDIGELMFSDKDGVIIYKDVSLNATGGNKEQNFPEARFNIEGKNELKSHGLFNKKGDTFNIGSSEQDVVKGMYYTIGVDIDIKRNNSKLKLNSPSNIIDTNTIEVYEYNREGKLINLLENVSVNKSGNIIEISGLNKGAYVVTYTASFNSSATISAILDNKNKEFKANLKGGGEDPESYLPELF